MIAYKILIVDDERSHQRDDKGCSGVSVGFQCIEAASAMFRPCQLIVDERPDLIST